MREYLKSAGKALAIAIVSTVALWSMLWVYWYWWVQYSAGSIGVRI